MRTQSILAGGLLLVLGASGVVKASDSFASEGQRTGVFERIGAGGSIYTQRQSVPVQSGKATVAGTERGKVDVIKRIGMGGSIYSSSQRDGGVIECAATEGVVCPYSQPTSH